MLCLILHLNIANHKVTDFPINRRTLNVYVPHAAPSVSSCSHTILRLRCCRRMAVHRVTSRRATTIRSHTFYTRPSQDSRTVEFTVTGRRFQSPRYWLAQTRVHLSAGKNKIAYFSSCAHKTHTVMHTGRPPCPPSAAKCACTRSSSLKTKLEFYLYCTQVHRDTRSGPFCAHA